MITVTDERPAIDTQKLLALIDRLEVLLQTSQLAEIEVEAAGMALVLRTPAAVAPQASVDVAAPSPPSGAEAAPLSPADDGPRPLAVLAPLTGLYYGSPSPGADPYVREGSEVHIGQVIGLIEAMKLFNEIKSDQAGRVVRICAGDGALVKAKQPLIELAPM